MIKVWVLIIMLGSDSRVNTNGITVVDNIYNKSECERIEKHIHSMADGDFTKTKCVEVWKTK